MLLVGMKLKQGNFLRQKVMPREKQRYEPSKVIRLAVSENDCTGHEEGVWSDHSSFH